MTTTSPRTSRPDGIRFTDRVFVGGMNGAGKSGVINHLAGLYRCQVLLYDTKDEFTVPGVEAVHRPEQIDWDQRVIHLIDDNGDLADTDRLFKTAWQRKVGRTGHHYGLVVVVHELGDLCSDQPGRTPQWFSNYVRKGRAHGLGLLCGSQRPRNIPRVARSEARHVFSMARGYDPEDLPVMAALHQMNVRELERALDQAHANSEYAYVWTDRVNRATVIRPALPPEKLRGLAIGIDPSKHRAPEPENTGPSPENEPVAAESTG